MVCRVNGCTPSPSEATPSYRDWTGEPESKQPPAKPSRGSRELGVELGRCSSLACASRLHRVLAILCRYARRSFRIDIVAVDRRLRRRPRPHHRLHRRRRRCHSSRRRSRDYWRNEARRCNDRATIGQPHVSTAVDSTRDEKKRESRARPLGIRWFKDRKLLLAKAHFAVTARSQWTARFKLFFFFSLFFREENVYKCRLGSCESLTIVSRLQRFL